MRISVHEILFCGSQCVVCAQMVGQMHRAVLMGVPHGCEYIFAVLRILIYVAILGMTSHMYRVTWMKKLLM